MDNILIIDDERTLKVPGAIYARTSTEALQILQADTYATWDAIYFDHDLGMDAHGVEDTVYPVVHYLEERKFYGQPIVIAVCYIITGNPVGRQMLERALSPMYDIHHLDVARLVVGPDTSRPNPSTVLGRMYDTYNTEG